ncbi:MAG: large subunit ribosomal protein [Pyrinomonadaceae bacterium]|nr:large subunit ribosomal protein [Pyrinomonadaceae bacterium]
MRTVWDIIKSPVITEKALVAKEETQDGKQLLTFRVDKNATKPEIKSAIEKIFDVKVATVRTMNYMGKKARRGRFEGRKPSWKKAYVTLKEGEKPLDYGEAIYKQFQVSSFKFQVQHQRTSDLKPET